MKTFKHFMSEAKVKPILKDTSKLRIARGMGINVNVTVEEAEKIQTRKLTLQDLLRITKLKRLSNWWYREGPAWEGNKEVELTLNNILYGAMEAIFPEAEDTLDSGWGQAMLANAKIGEGLRSKYKASFDLPIVLVGQCPPGWDPEDNPDGGLTGNSYINKRTWPTVKLLDIYYWSVPVGFKESRLNIKNFHRIPANITMKL